MTKWILISFLVSHNVWAGNSLAEISKRCGPLSTHEQTLYFDEFSWAYDIPELLLKFTQVYNSPKRLPNRAFWDAKKQVLKLPYDAYHGGDVEINETFIQTVVRHIELAFENQYVDAVFFPDMGHSHFLVPEQIMKDKYQPYPVSNMSGMMTEMLQDEEIKILYHTAEQIRQRDDQGGLRNDPRLQWRYQTRNVVGQNRINTDLKIMQNPASLQNTVEGAPGYFWWGSGFNLSSQKEGCFEYKAHGHVLYFDLSLSDLIPDPQGSKGGAY